MNCALSTPKTLTMKQRILELLTQGIHLSELEGVYYYCLGTSFRTRISELRKDGHKIKDYFVESASGSRYKKYWIEKDEK